MVINMAKTAKDLIKELMELPNLDAEVMVRTDVDGIWASFSIHCVDFDGDNYVAIHFDNFNHLTLKENEERKRKNSTPCDEPEYNGEHHCPYEDTYTGYESEMCRVCCGLGVDE